MDTEFKSALKAGVEAVEYLRQLQDRMLPLIQETTVIMQGGLIELRALELAEAIERQKKRIEELGHKGRSWTGR